jgi:glycosyltransferase involved in cell wall biosynthesis
MEIIEMILLMILGLYMVVVVVLIVGLLRLSSFQVLPAIPQSSFTIVVPFRNEKEQLPILLKSLEQLNYPRELFEVLLVDDDSEDGFILPKVDFTVKVLTSHRQSNAPKKDAIQTAVEYASHPWIVTTDADCEVPCTWLSTLNAFIKNHPKVAMVCSTVVYGESHGFLQHFQQLDLLSLQGATMGSFGIGLPFMCNGAHFAYTKSFYKELNGYEGNDSISSGDDVFLLQKAVVRFPEKVAYLKLNTQVVTTRYAATWKELIHQRVRWAAKSTAYKSWFGKAIALIVFMANGSVIIAFLLWIMQSIALDTFLLLLGMKVSVDIILLLQMTLWLKKIPKAILVSSLFYPFFSFSVALYSLWGTYTWKGRTARQ